jgi:hypothetical protein
MVQTTIQERITISETQDLHEIQEALSELLYVPDPRLKPLIIKQYLIYLESIFSLSTYPFKIFIAYSGGEVCGFVSSQVHPTYTSYSRKCGTFGWILGEDFVVCRRLLNNCEKFLKEQKVRKIRGNINFPKHLGGIGFQTMGFDEPMMCGIASDNPQSRIQDFLKSLGYIREAEYTCVHVIDTSWKQGHKRLAKDIKIRYLTIDEIIGRKAEILDIARNSFRVLLPDSSGGDTGFNEIIGIYRQIPKSFYSLFKGIMPYSYSKRPEYRDAWDNCDLSKIVPFAPCAIDRSTDKIVGIILAIPNLYQIWLGEPITHANVDTAMIHKEYARKGIFSNLNNIGQITIDFYGVDYMEGTTIWSNNEKAIVAIFPHSVPIRKHQVYQKRLK